MVVPCKRVLHGRECYFRDFKTNAETSRCFGGDVRLKLSGLFSASITKKDVYTTYPNISQKCPDATEVSSVDPCVGEKATTCEMVTKAVKTPVSYTLRAKDQFLGCDGAFFCIMTTLSSRTMSPCSARALCTSLGTRDISGGCDVRIKTPNSEIGEDADNACGLSEQM
jgi:hypothetical protein